MGEVIDFMVPETRESGRARDLLVRKARAVRGRVTFELACHPAFDYGRVGHEVEIVSGVGAVFTSSLGRAVLRSDVPLKIEEGPALGRSGVAATFTLDEGQEANFHLEWNGEIRPLAPDETQELFTRTQDYWQGWLAQSRYRGRWREMVHRSALALKLLVYHPTGALVAAPTTSLPEEPGGTRNWDYRYAWLRDAAFTTYALMRLGFLEEAGSFMDWIQQRCETATKERDIMIMYTIDGSADLDEQVLDHLDGLPRRAPGPDRQRGGRPAADRRLWRADGLGVPVQQGAADLLRPVDRALEAPRLAVEALGGARRGHLGDPRPPPAVHLLGPDDLGCL